MTASPVTQDLTAAREALARRQSEVLADLLAGRVPPGFDPFTSRATSRVLRAKRRRAAVRARPFLAGVADLPTLFERWSQDHPAPGCGHEDADAFLHWADGAGLLSRPVRHSWRALQVDLGLRRVAVVHLAGRWVVVLGVGPRYVELSVRAARPAVHPHGKH